MHRRHQQNNIPTELVRTLVVIGETHSFSKAGDKLGLSQPAISAQVKRLQVMIGGPVFERSGHGGLELTPRGRMVLTHARKLLEANDQILSLVGTAGEVASIRLGLAVPYADDFLSILQQTRMPQGLHFTCNGSAEISRSLCDGFIDIACISESEHQTEDFASTWEEEIVWVRSPDFVLSPGSPIPLVNWPGSWLDMRVVNSLQRAGVAYRIAFASIDHHSRMAAVVAGIGIMGLHRRQVCGPLVVASEYYLPALETVRAGIAIRPGFNVSDAKELAAALERLAPSAAVRAPIHR
jgi:DNA-binding transcriptional LysR family regulator